MAWELPLFQIGQFCADIDMSAASYRFAPVWLGPAANITGTDGGALVAKGSLTYSMFGILQAPVKQGAPGHVMTHGVSKFLAGGTIAFWDPLTWNAGGTALIKAVASGAIIAARSLGAYASGNYGSCFLTPAYGGIIP
jgi:hypothetical protein